MKRIFIIAILGVCMTCTYAQTTMQRSSLLDFKADSTSMHLVYMLAADSTLGSDYALCCTPLLTNGRGDSLLLEPIMFRGKRNMRYIERRRFYNKATQATAAELPLNATQKRELTLSRKDYPWLWHGEITLGMKMEKEGCCKVEELAMRQLGQFKYIPPFIPVFAEVDANTGKAGELQKDNPVLQHISQYRPYDDTRILSKEEGALYVHYPVNKADLLHDFRNNAATLDQIEDITKAIMADSTSSVKIIQIIGLASVEGPQKSNSTLASNRAEALRRYIQQKVNTPDSLYECVNGGEAWAELRDKINYTDFEWRESLLAIIDSKLEPDNKERKIKALDNGRAYAYLKEHILKDQRNSGYVRIYYDYVPDIAAKCINEASALMREGKYAEALYTLKTVEKDERAQNALGVAYYMTGDKEKGIELMRRAAANGNESARRNIEQLERQQ